MRIEVDARMLMAGGIGRFIRETCGRWVEDRRVEAVRLFGRPDELEPWLAGLDYHGAIEIVPWLDPPYRFRAQLRWLGPLARRRSWQPDVTLFPHYDAPAFKHPLPSVTVIHDLIQLQLPRLCPGWKRLLAAGLLRRVASESAHLVTVSDASRTALVRGLGLRPDQVTVVANGVSRIFTAGRRPAPALAAVERRGVPFVLCVAEHRPHKNLALAVRAMAKLPEREGWELLVVGASERDVRALTINIGCRGVLPRIRVRPHVTDAELRDLYSSAHSVLVPSLEEGFALPAWEARACGAPVLVLDRPWSQDLAKLGVTRVRSGDPSAWARHIRRISSEPRTFPPLEAIPSWDETACRLLDVLDQTAALCGPRGT
ncbi:MAG: glycosyltransferase family 1 protein [Gemmatimonadota bacterium]|nr:glycosyltransferase family 1 protein [Gemmatimonadota bacterium]